MKLQKTQLAAAVGVALLAVGGTAFGQAAPNVQVYGQVSRSLLYADDGTQAKWFNVDNESSGTRLGVTGGAPVNAGLRAGFRIEVDLQSNESQRVTFSPQAGTFGPQSNFNGTDEDHGGFADRYFDAWLEGAWGRVSLGQGDGAANGASESDLSGTNMANGIGVADLGGGFNFRNSNTKALLSNITATINQQDFESRYDRLMYTTPTFSGFRAQVSWGNKAASGVTPTNTVGQSVSANTDVKEASLWYDGKFGSLGQIAAVIGYSTRGASGPGLTHDVYTGGSIAWLHSSGFNIALSHTTRDNPTTVAGSAVRSSDFNYVKIGFKFGQHAIAVDYAKGDDFAQLNDESTMYGIGYVWNPVRWLEIVAGYKMHSLDRPGTPTDDITIAHVGTRIRF